MSIRYVVLACLLVSSSLLAQQTQPIKVAANYTAPDSSRPYKWLGPGSEAKLTLPDGRRPIKWAIEYETDQMTKARTIRGYHAVYEESVEGGPKDPKTGEEIICDLPGEAHMKNRGGSDGAGLCVYTSFNHAAYWQQVECCYDLQKWTSKYPGGSYPSKFDESIRQKTKGKFKDYLNITGREQCRELCRRGLATGRMISTTYGYSPRYGEAVAHMVNLVHLKNGRACILDNNFPGENKYEWMSEDEFFRRQDMMGGPWVLMLLTSPPPPARIEVK